LWRRFHLFFGALGQLLIVRGNLKHHAPSLVIGKLFGVGACFLGALAPMFRIFKGDDERARLLMRGDYL
jgi:hypothetical protein